MSHSHIIKGGSFRSGVFSGAEFLLVRSKNKTPLTYIIVDIPNYEILHRKQNCTVWNKKLDQTNLFRKI